MAEQLIGVLRKRGVATGKEIQGDLGISQPVMSRLIGAAGPRIRRLGRGRATRYALPREIADLGTWVPVHRVDEAGRPVRHGVLYFIAGDRNWLDRKTGAGQLFDGLPPFADDMKPQGYLGAGFPAQFPELELPGRISDWSDDHHLIALARRGEDCVGNLIIGEESLDRFLAQPPPPRTRKDYHELARGALAGQPGSSAGGEHPKFAVYSDGRHLLVKFAAGDGAAADRWRDLLVCEHIAHQVLSEAGIPAVRSEWFDQGGERFLQVERFDRSGERGRHGVISLAAVNSYFLGYTPGNWSKAAQHILEEPSLRIESECVERIIWLDTFGDLIANTDRHFGNISFFAEEAEVLSLALTPAYDMLPMAFAPRGAALADSAFAPRPPTALNLHLWDEAAKAAVAYWDLLREEESLSGEFRKKCSGCRDAVASIIAQRP